MEFLTANLPKNSRLIQKIAVSKNHDSPLSDPLRS
jgi:hypothetical protein